MPVLPGPRKSLDKLSVLCNIWTLQKNGTYCRLPIASPRSLTLALTLTLTLTSTLTLIGKKHEILASMPGRHPSDHANYSERVDGVLAAPPPGDVFAFDGRCKTDPHYLFVRGLSRGNIMLEFQLRERDPKTGATLRKVYTLYTPKPELTITASSY